MNDKNNIVSTADATQLDVEFYTSLGWLSALSVSIAGFICNA